MENLPNLDYNADSSGPSSLHIPVEVCENIIDMLYSHNPADTINETIALHSCALVCRAWRVRSQKVLFYKVQLFDSPSFHKLAATLNTGRHLRDYVHEIGLIGFHLHTTISIFALFPVVFAGKLPNLQRMDVVNLHKNSPTHWPRKPDPPKLKSLPHIPLHPRFQAFLSTFTAVSVLYLGATTFRSFTEFVRMLHCLPNLAELTCYSVHWIATGGWPPGANVTPDWALGTTTLPPFAPKLRNLIVRGSTVLIPLQSSVHRVSRSKE